MNRLHIIGAKNHGKTTLIVELVQEFARRGLPVGTIKHTHHNHELDVPGKDSFRHREAGAGVVAILSPRMSAVFLPEEQDGLCDQDRYAHFSELFRRCRLVLVEGDTQTTAPKIEVWRSALGTPPLAARDRSILALVTDDESPTATLALSRRDVSKLADWIYAQAPASTLPTPMQACATCQD